MTVVDRQLQHRGIGARSDLLAERRFHFLESHMREPDHRRTGERHFDLLANAKKSGQRQRAVFCRRLFQNSAQAGGDTAGNECIAIAPKIDPRRSVTRDFVHQIFANCETAFAETFFADRVAR